MVLAETVNDLKICLGVFLVFFVFCLVISAISRANKKEREEKKRLAAEVKRIEAARSIVIEEMRKGGAGGGSQVSIADELRKLSELTQGGILTGDELERAKAMLIGRPQSHIDKSVQLLKHLNDLRRQGVLSESEFNMKKWDVLSKRDFQ